MQLIEKRYYTPDEYLQLEEDAETRNEYVDGQIIPMAGGTTNHNRIALNLSAALNFAFRQENYEVFMSDVRLWIPERRIYTYPDVMIVAGEPQYLNDRTDIILNPQVIIEVLSNSTQGYDRENKFAAYRTIPTFQEYILVDQTRIRVEQFSKSAKKRWIMCEYDNEDEKVALTTLPFEITFADLYNKVKFPAIESSESTTESEGTPGSSTPV